MIKKYKNKRLHLLYVSIKIFLYMKQKIAYKLLSKRNFHRSENRIYKRVAKLNFATCVDVFKSAANVILNRFFIYFVKTRNY